MKPKAEAMKDLARVRRRTIVVQKKIDGYDGIGNPVEIWSNWRTLKAEKTELFGQEYYAAAAVGQEQTTIFTVPYVSFIDAMNTVEYRLLYDGKAYDLKHIDHLPGETWVKLRAIERPGADMGMKLIDHELVQGLKALVEEILADEDVTMDLETKEAYQAALAELLEGW